MLLKALCERGLVVKRPWRLPDPCHHSRTHDGKDTLNYGRRRSIMTVSFPSGQLAFQLSLTSSSPNFFSLSFFYVVFNVLFGSLYSRRLRDFVNHSELGLRQWHKFEVPRVIT